MRPARTGARKKRLALSMRFHPKCHGTIEDHRKIALDARELIRQRVFERRVGTVFRLAIRFPWLRTLRLDSSSLDLQLATGRTEVVPLVWARCGVLGGRLRLECPRCSQRVCMLYHLDGQVICRKCGRLWYTAQRTSSSRRKFLAIRKIRRKLGDYGQLRADRPPPKPPQMWRKTYARHLAALARIERSLYLPQRRRR